ncbi:MAG TPA: hypothetical protein VLN09_10110 [Psychrobacter sp.]|nr:hypothetical protein [Psychrobacter sp.]HSP86074.1 hypothetical protein [Psychrobacter sp.]
MLEDALGDQPLSAHRADTLQLVMSDIVVNKLDNWLLPVQNLTCDSTTVT